MWVHWTDTHTFRLATSSLFYLHGMFKTKAIIEKSRLSLGGPQRPRGIKTFVIYCEADPQRALKMNKEYLNKSCISESIQLYCQLN